MMIALIVTILALSASGTTADTGSSPTTPAPVSLPSVVSPQLPDMMFSARTCLALCACWTAATEAWSRNVLDFMSALTGEYDNVAQIRSQGRHDFILCKVVPVSVPALPGKAVLYTEWAVNGETIYMTLVEVADGKAGTIDLTLHNFTDISLHKPRTYNVDDLSSLTTNDLHTEPYCKSTFLPVGGNTFMGTWPECREQDDGVHDIYVSVVTCGSWKITVPVAGLEETSLVAYSLERRSGRYPLINAPEDYRSPCN